MNKKKVIVLSVIGITIFCMLAGMTACTAIFVNELEKEEQRIEKPVIEDEYLNEDDLDMIELPGQPAPEESHVKQGEAYDAVAPYVHEAFGGTGLNYTLEEETLDGETTVTLTIDLPYEEIRVAAQDGTWNEISELGLLASEQMYNVFQSQGIDAHFIIAIEDSSLDEVYYVAINGELVFDVPSGVQ